MTRQRISEVLLLISNVDEVTLSDGRGGGEIIIKLTPGAETHLDLEQKQELLRECGARLALDRPFGIEWTLRMRGVVGSGATPYNAWIEYTVP